MRAVHYPLTASPETADIFAGAWRPACGTTSSSISDDVVEVTCQRCVESRYGPNGAEARARSERRWDRARARARDRRDAEKVVLARHADELEYELAMRAIARIGS